MKMILKLKDAAKKLNVTVGTLQRWDRTGILVSYRYPKTNRRYYTDDQVDTFLKEGGK